VIVLDASVWLSVLIMGDVFHSEARAWSNLLPNRRTVFAVPAHFPAEVIGVLRRSNAQSVDIQEALDTITNEGPFAIHPISIELGLLAAEAARETATRGSDALYLALAAWLDVPLVTWDKQQRERGAVFCRTMTPVEAMEMSE
jgi:predicted nucleic acid-binding protein